jgi:hypothetical protein
MPIMADAIFLRLNEKFALGADDLQWGLYKSRRKEPSPLDSNLVFGRGSEWEPVSFISSIKEILFRCMREKGCNPCDEAQVALERYPDTFRDWIASRHARNTAAVAVQTMRDALASGPKNKCSGDIHPQDVAQNTIGARGVAQAQSRPSTGF